MNRSSTLYSGIVTAVLLVALGGGWWYFRSSTQRNPTIAQQAFGVAGYAASQESSSTAAAPSNQAYFLESTLHFFFQLPGGFTAYEYPPQGNETVIVVGDNTGRGMLIQILPISGTPTAFVQSDIAQIDPNIPVANVAPMTVAGESGLEFDSTNARLGTPSRELWFFHQGHLYELSVHAEDASLLDTFANSWVFR